MSNEMIFATVSVIILVTTDLALFTMARLLKTIQLGIGTLMDMLLTLGKAGLYHDDKKDE